MVSGLAESSGLPPRTRALYLATGSLCAVLFVIVVIELIPTVSGADASSGDMPAVAGTDAGGSTDDAVDALVAAIQERPLFTPGRRPPAPPPQPTAPEARPEVKTPPELKGRLAGVTLGPDDIKVAVFARMGEKPMTLKEGDEIDGWTVATIESSRVVLTSSFGEKILQPTAGVPGEGPAPDVPAGRRGVAVPAVQPQMPPQMVRPGQPAVPGFPAARAMPNMPGPMPNFVGAPGGPNARAARRNQ